MKWLILFLGISSNALASVLIKLAVTEPRKFPTLLHPLSLFSNWPFWMGLFLYGVAFILYAAALERLPLNIAHPILTTGAVIMVMLLSTLILKEPIYWTTIFGVLLVIAGVVLIYTGVK